MLHQKKIQRICLFLLLFLLVGCKGDMSPQNTEQDIEKVSDVVYFPWESRLVFVDNSTNRIKYFKTGDNDFQYSFNTPCNYYTSGNSDSNGFEIIKSEKASIQSVYKLDNNDDAIFPLAATEDRYFFVVTDYSDGGLGNSEIYEFKNNELYLFKNSMAHISGSGAIIEDDLYYTVYNTAEQWFTIYRIKINDYDSYPMPILDKVEHNQLYVINNEVYYRDTENLVGIDSGIVRESVMSMITWPEENIFIRFPVSKEDSRYLNCTVINTKDEKIIYSNDRVLGYNIQNNILALYSADGMIYYDPLNLTGDE